MIASTTLQKPLTIIHTASFTESSLAPVAQTIFDPLPSTEKAKRSLTSSLKAHPFSAGLTSAVGGHNRLVRRGQ